MYYFNPPKVNLDVLEWASNGTAAHNVPEYIRDLCRPSVVLEIGGVPIHILTNRRFGEDEWYLCAPTR